MKNDQRKIKIINHLKVYGSITSKDVQSLTGAHRNTALSDLKLLEEENVIQSSGTGKGTHYRLVQELVFDPKEIVALFIKKDQTTLNRYFKKPNRKSVFFNQVKEQALTTDFKPPEYFNAQVERFKKYVEEIKRTLSPHEQKRKKQRLVIDLSWASSYIEGNTYSLLETESLIEHQETAEGKKYFEAKMILNHKSAIEFIREYKDYKRVSKKNIFELHQILIDGLGVETGLRRHLVRISNSSYVPCDNEFQIMQTLDEVVTAINSAPSILQKAIMANLLLAFLQPFADGNKRTSRMLGNAVLVSHGLLPLSFSHTPKTEYIKSILSFYERQDPAYFIYLFFNELNTSFVKYIE